MPGLKYLRIEKEYYDTQIASGKWEAITAPLYYNGFNSWSLVKDTKTGREIKAIIRIQ